jgi:hypothetical protein
MMEASAVRKLYLNVAQFNPPANERLRVLHNELPDRLNIHDGLVDGTHRAWVSYPAWYGDDKARADIAGTLAELGYTDITLAD